MSEYSALVNVSEALRDMLWERLAGDPAIHAILSDRSQISLSPPYQFTGNPRSQKSHVSVYLFRVEPNAHARNQPVAPASPTTHPGQPLALDLYYVITPLTKSPDDDQRVLDKIIRVFHDNPILVGGGPGLNGLLQPVGEQTRVSLVAHSMDELCELWTAFRQPLRLSICYALGPVFLD